MSDRAYIGLVLAIVLWLLVFNTGLTLWVFR